MRCLRQLSWMISVLGLCCLHVATFVDGGLENMSDECLLAVSSFDNHHQTVAGQAAINAQRMLYFLHIPRTAGRTFGTCFLKQAWTPSRRCAKSYDVLRLNSSVPDCGLLTSHDDYSVIQYLPADAAVATQLRDPVDRVVSMYEFAMEVSARSLAPDGPGGDPSKVDTRSVWPWSLLVPFLCLDMRQRVRAMHTFQKQQRVV